MDEFSYDKRIWVVLRDVLVTQLEAALNQLADDGYQVHSVPFDKDKGTFMVLAFDSARIMAKHSATMSKQLQDALGLVQEPTKAEPPV